MGMIRGRIASGVTVCVLAFSAIAGAYAEDMPSPVRIEKIEVTGSHIKRVDTETGLPVTTITRSEIERSGATTVEQLLATISAIGPGGHNLAEGVGDSYRSGLSAVSLRGLGSDNTLVLINGRRLANFAFNTIGGGTVNVNQIPLAAVDRVEVLKDGASAIYGTDAIGGVINFILRKDYRGVEVDASGAWTQDGGAGSRKFSTTLGYGDLAVDRFNILALVEYQKNGGLRASQRSFASTAIRPDLGFALTSTSTFPANFNYGGARYNLTAANGCLPSVGSVRVNQFTGEPAPLQNFCLYDFTSVIDILPPSERKGLFGRGVWQIAADHQAFAEYHRMRMDTLFAVSEMPVADFTGRGLISYPAGGPYYPSSVTLADGTVIHPSGDLPIRWRLLSAGRRVDRIETDEGSWTAGLQGQLWGWDYDAALSGGISTVRDVYLGGFVRESSLGRALQTGLIDVFSARPLTPEAQALIDQALILGKVRESESRVTSATAKASREILSGRHGPTSLAIGFDYRKEELEERPDEVLFSGDILGFGTPILPTTRASRTIASAFAELNVPVLPHLEAQLAVRYDRFSDFGGTTNPKVALRWTPSSQILARASYGTGFRAPTLTDLFLPATDGFFFQSDPARCSSSPDGPIPIGPYVSPDECSELRSHFGGNRRAQPERSRQWTLGLVFEPKAGTSLSLDYWTIRRRGSLGVDTDVAIFDTYAVEDPVTALGRFVRRPRLPDGRCAGDTDIPTPVGVPCAIEIVNQLIVNLGKTNVSGIDVSASARTAQAQWGSLAFRVDGTYFLRYRYQLIADGPYKDNVGLLVDSWAVSRWRHYAALDWHRGPWDARIAHNFVLGYIDQEQSDAAGNPLPSRRVASYETYDVQGAWSGWKGFKATVGVRNLLNRDPPASRQTNTFQVGYDARYYDPRGRTAYLALRYAFK